MATQPDDSWWQSVPTVSPANDAGFTGFIPGAPKSPSIPANYEPDPDHPGAVRPIKGGPADPTAGQSVEASDLTGDDYLKTLDKPTSSMVRALAEGRKSFPSGAALKAPYWQQMLGHVGNYDPGFDETTYTTRSATRKDFSIGAAGKNIRALNTAIGHLGQLYGQIDGTASHGLVPFNAVENAVLSATGDSGPTTYKSTTSALAGELTAVYRGSGGAEADIQRYINELSPNASEAQKKATIKNIAGLLNSRLNALQDQYQKGMGVGAKGYQFLDPTAEKVLGTINGSAAPSPPPPSGGGGGNGPPGVSDLNDSQKQAYQAFLAANPKPTGDQVGTFLSKLTGKEVTNGNEIAKAIAEGRGVSTSVENLTEQQEAQQLVDKMKSESSGKADAAGVGIADGITLGTADELNAFGQAVRGSLGGKGSFRHLYNVNVDANRAYEDYIRGEHPVFYTGGQLAGGAVLAPLGGAGEAESVGELAKIGAKTGAAYGGAYGFGSGEGSGRITGAVEGAIGGATVGALAPYAVKFGADKIGALRAARGMAPDVADAAQAEGVDLLRPMVDPASRGKFGSLESAPGSQNVIRAGIDKTKGQIEGRVGDLGEGGTALEFGAAGERLQLSGNRYIERSRGIASRLYDHAQKLAGGEKFTPTKAIEQAQLELAELRQNPNTNAGEIKFVEGVLDDLSSANGKTVDQLRQLRTSLRGRIGEQNLTSTQAEARAMRIIGQATEDMNVLPPGAARAFKRADGFYRDRQTVVDDIKRSILGNRNDPLDPQKAFANLKTLSAPGGNLRRLSAVTRYLEPEERADVAATVASTLGRKAQDAPFSSDLFLQQTDKMSPSALRTIFGPGGAESISNLRLLSQKLKEGVGDINRSKTANSMWRLMANRFVGSLTGIGGAAGLIEGGMAGGGTGAATGLLVGGAVKGTGMARNILSARAMVNPRVSQWLAQAVDVSTPSQAKAAVRGLSLVISREPALAHELIPIRDFLDQRVTQQLAAEPNDQNEQ